jgi:hypothetical protein
MLPIKDFRCDIVRRATDRTFSLAVKLKFRGQAKVSQLDLHFLVKEQIPEFQVPMDNSMLMQVFQRAYDLM